MSTRALGRHTRPKKLGQKQTVQIFRESDVDLQPDHEVNRVGGVVPVVETGVEKAEESEYHLQQAINAAQAAVSGERFKEAHIPTPPTISSDVQYDVLYPSRFEQPATYIRSSATVEDHCVGTTYCIDETDDLARQKLNFHLPPDLKPCSEDQFEQLMGFFEETAQEKQPFAAVDNPPVLPLVDLEERFDDSVSPETRKLAKHVYEHWKTRRLESANRSLQWHLKSETGQDTDDADPYICFRRREIRQIRKTRHRDANSAEKLRRLRKELEDARHILAMVKQREMTRKEVLNADKALFKQRAEVKEIKRKLSIRGDDEDLINQKPKKKTAESVGQNLSPHIRLTMPGRGGTGDDMRSLDDWQAERSKAIEKDIQQNTEKHIKWNIGFVDKTRAPLTPVPSRSFVSNSDFREAIPATEYLPTPPASVSSENTPVVDSVADVDSTSLHPQHHHLPQAVSPLHYSSSSPPPIVEDDDDNNPPHNNHSVSNVAVPSFRRRLGRGGRTMFDRRFPCRTKDLADSHHDSDLVASRYKFDLDDDQPHNHHLHLHPRYSHVLHRGLYDNDDDNQHQRQVDLMNERAFLFSRARETESANSQSQSHFQTQPQINNRRPLTEGGGSASSPKVEDNAAGMPVGGQNLSTATIGAVVK